MGLPGGALFAPQPQRVLLRGQRAPLVRGDRPVPGDELRPRAQGHLLPRHIGAVGHRPRGAGGEEWPALRVGEVELFLIRRQVRPPPEGQLLQGVVVHPGGEVG